MRRRAAAAAALAVAILLAECLAPLATRIGPEWLTVASPARAETLPSNPPLPPIPAPGDGADPGAGEALPPYEPQLERLSERLGTLTYLRSLCGKPDAAEWRQRMTALLDAEARTETRRQRLAGAFNRGFRGYQATYRACTPSAELVISRFLAEGDRLAHDLAARYSGT